MIGKTKRKVIIQVAIVCLMAMLTVGIVHAAPATRPGPEYGLKVGDTYRLAFVTSVPTIASSGDIQAYNAFVSGVANSVPELADLGASWTAIVSTNAVAAVDNTATIPFEDPARFGGIFNTSGRGFARGYSHMWGIEQLDTCGNDLTCAPINGDENGIVRNELVWTGTAADGTASPDRYLGSGQEMLGDSGATLPNTFQRSDRWIEFGAQLPGTVGAHRVYALSSVLEVPVPIPGAVWLLGSGLLGVIGLRRRSKK